MNTYVLPDPSSLKGLAFLPFPFFVFSFFRLSSSFGGHGCCFLYFEPVGLFSSPYHAFLTRRLAFFFPPSCFALPLPLFSLSPQWVCFVSLWVDLRSAFSDLSGALSALFGVAGCLSAPFLPSGLPSIPIPPIPQHLY